MTLAKSRPLLDQRFTPTESTHHEMIGKDLTEKQLQAAELMAARVSDSALARAAGAHGVTVSRWRTVQTRRSIGGP